MATWKNITIEKYDKIVSLQQENLSELDLIAAVIAVLDGVAVSEVEEMPYATLVLKARGLRFMHEKPLPSLVKKTYELNGKKYNAVLNPLDITTAQYIDFQVRANEAPDDLAGLLSVFLIPDGFKYNEGYYSDDVRTDIYKYLPIEDAMGLSAFFFALWKKSIHRLLRENRRNYRQLKRKKNKTAEEMQLMEITEKLMTTLKKMEKYL